DAEVVEAEEAALKDIAALRVLAVHPPGEVEHQLVENALEEFAVSLAAPLLLDLIDTPRRPGHHRRGHVAEGPFIGRNLPVRVHVPLAQQELALRLCEACGAEPQRAEVAGEGVS